MSPGPGQVSDGNAALLTDLYQLTMLQAYWKEGFNEEAVFSLYFRRLPASRNYILACGLDDALRYLETLHFARDALDYLRSLAGFEAAFLDWLGEFQFTGDVYALPEGTPVFPEEPLVEVVAPIGEAQIAETFLLNQIHFQSVAASKAARVVAAAEGRPIIDFALRRAHGSDAGLKGARAFYVAGVSATSNVLAGQMYGIPVAGTMAHSYIEAHDREADAFRAFATLYPDTTLLVDTYDALAGVREVVALARELGDAFRVRAVRLDSGDLAQLARAARKILDDAQLEQIEIFASGGLDEYRIAELIRSKAPIAGFGVGTHMGASEDAPTLDMVYKLTEYAGRGRLKASPGKRVLPGRKQVFRRANGQGDTIGRHGESLTGRPLLEPVMRGGRRLAAGRVGLSAARERARSELAALPEALRALDPAPPYPVEISPALSKYHREVMTERLTGG